MSNFVITNPQLFDQIKAKIEEIAYTLTYYNEKENGLMGGKSGISLFWAYHSIYTNNNGCDKYSNLIKDCLDDVRQGFTYFSFAQGLSGIGWTLEHLVKNHFIQANTDIVLEDIDKYLFHKMIREMRKGNFDYLHGSLGVCLYYLERLSNPAVRNYLVILIEELEKRGSSFNDKTRAWESMVKIGNKDIKCFNLSMSHGIASIIVLLSKFYKEGIHMKKVQELALSAVNYLLLNQNNSFIYRFPGFVDFSGQKQERSGRLAWCYSDLGVSMALLQAGKAFGKDNWYNIAMDTLFSTTKIIDLRQANVLDAGLCHGSVGIAHIYSQLFKTTKDETFKNAAEYWFQQTLNLAEYSDGLAGFKAYSTPEYGGYHNNYGLLEGIAGIGLAMISAVSNVEPNWDRLLLLR